LVLGVQLAKQKLAVVFLGQLDQDRRQSQARLAPAGPEIQQYRYLEGGLHDLLVVFTGDVDDER
jgi:hypothetical protein